ncbi:hypothetical protein K438DRAFT_1784039 [Mycena galopus ATCC 62051]|nr:hypothetical protein K438DRAFT_1784039 [Mycena galopus ATCC 62051]
MSGGQDIRGRVSGKWDAQGRTSRRGDDAGGPEHPDVRAELDGVLNRELWKRRVSTGLAASIVLMLLLPQHLLFRTDEKTEQSMPIDGTGLLHTIWLYRNHSELEMPLEHAEHPTDDSLHDVEMNQKAKVNWDTSNEFCTCNYACASLAVPELHDLKGRDAALHYQGDQR